jgi:hypothetical protein
MAIRHHIWIFRRERLVDRKPISQASSVEATQKDEVRGVNYATMWLSQQGVSVHMHWYMTYRVM